MGYKVSFDFPYGKTWLSGTFGYENNKVTYPAFTSAADYAKIFEEKTIAEANARFYAGSYKYDIVEV